jgi:protocatechuate 3,4-dioxygenase beta subunit
MVDQSGRFVFTGLPAGTYEVTAVKRGSVNGEYGKLRADGTRSSFQLAEHERRLDVTIRVWKHASLAGVVLDEHGEPVVGVSVYALRREDVAGQLGLEMAGQGATTDDRGAYRLGSLLAGEYLVGVPATQFTIPADALDQYIANTAPPHLRNSVARVAGIPAAPGTRDTQRVGNLVLHGTARSIVPPALGADGRLRVYTAAYHPPRADGTEDRLIPLANGEAKTLPPIHLQPTVAGRVSGRVIGPYGPVPFANLMLVPHETAGFTSEHGFEAARAMADADGAFTFLGVTPGAYVLRAQAQGPEPPAAAKLSSARPAMPDQFWLAEPVTVGDRDTTLSLTMRPALTVSGRLEFEGQRAQPQPGQIVRNIVRLTPADGRQISSLTGRDPGSPPGSFEIADIGGGRYQFRLTSVPSGWYVKSIVHEGRDIIDTPIDLTASVRDVVITFTDRPAPLRGVVRSPAGTVDPDSLVIVFPASPERWVDFGRFPLRLRGTRTDASGAFAFASLPPGDYLVAAVHDAGASNWQSRTFLQAIAGRATRARLDEGATVTQELRRIEVR